MIDANEEWPIAEPPSSDLHQDPVQHQDVGVGWGSGIFDQHREMLQASKITADHARARGYRSVDTKVRLGQIGIAKAGRRIPGLLMPLLGVDGKPWGWQNAGQWEAYGRWMYDNDLIKRRASPSALTNDLLPGEGF